MALPLLVALTVALIWVIAVAAAQVRTVDAAREAARVLARGDSEADAVELATRVAPDGARVSVRFGDGQVEVRVDAVVQPPGGLVSIGSARVSSTAVAALEPGTETSSDDGSASER